MTALFPSSAAYPVVRLRPKARAQAIRHGAPWVFADELVCDRRTRALAPGSIAVLQDDKRRLLGVVAINPASKIICRMLVHDSTATIDRDWLKARIQQALSLRERLYAEPFYRLVHAEADGLPGVIIDRFGEVAVVQPNAAWAERLVGEIAAALVEVAGISVVVKNGTGRARALEGLTNETVVLVGALEGPVRVAMNGATYFAELIGGQKTGLYFDQRDNHAFAARLAGGARVLDVFAHVGGFALAALVAGADSALAVDGSRTALDLACEGARASGVAARFVTRRGDAFKVMQALAGEGERFDLVVADPPAFAPSRHVLEAGLRAYERVALLATSLVAEGGCLVLCSCSHAVDLAKFHQACARGIGRAGRRAQLIHTGFAGPDHPVHPQLAESGYLKALHFRLLP